MHKQAEYREELNTQLEEAEKRKREEYQQFLLEKKMIDEAVRKIIEDDEQSVHLYRRSEFI